ncbi:MAG TPA: PVC-type heme-binding CxxCH protein [Chthoniobacteraceae bacterium]|jgi:putative membrane-bound dehydrogenase-like protein
MNLLPRLRFILLLGTFAAPSFAQTPAAPKPPIVHDPALKIELVATLPEVEACTTVCAAPDGSIYVGNDPRDGRLSTLDPVCTVVRFDQIGTGRKRTVFAEKLYSPAGSAWHDGWLYVIHNPLMSRFKDTNGDGVADVREDLITSLGMAPGEGLNDHVVSGFTLGMDGFFYISVGDRGIHRAKSAKDGSTITLQGGGIVRCRPDGSQLEIFSTGTRNHLQVNLDAQDNAITRDNTDDGNGWWTRLTHHIEGGFYGYPYHYQTATRYGVVQPSQQTLDALQRQGLRPAPGAPFAPQLAKPAPGVAVLPPDAGGLPSYRQADEAFLPAMADFGGGSPTGGLCYLSDGLPEKFRGKHFFSEWGKSGIFVTEIGPEGASFKLVSDLKLIEPEKGADFRPMQVSVAADGSLLIADWGYGGWKSGRRTGAVWRLSSVETKPAARLADERTASEEELLLALGHSDREQRLRAQLALVVRGAGIVEKVAALAKDENAPTLQRVHALWTLENLIVASSPGIAAAGTRMTHFQPTGLTLFTTVQPASSSAPAASLPQAQQALTTLLKSKDAAVRVQAIRALGETARYLPQETERIANSAQLTELLADPDASVRLHAATSLGRLGQQHSALRLVPALDDPDPWVRAAKRAALRRLTSWVPVVQGLESPSAAVREQSWRTISGVYDERLLPEVIRLTKVGDAAVRAQAVATLGQVAYQPTIYAGHWWGTQPAKTPPALASVVWSGTPRVVETLIASLADPDTGVRLAAAKAFSLGLGAQPLPALRARLTVESDAAVRRQVIESLGVQKDPQAMDVFMQIALDEKADAEFRSAGISAVVSIGGEPARKVIAQLANAKLNLGAMRKVIQAAGDLKVIEAAPALIARLKDGNAGNRQAAARALGQIGPRSKAGPALIEGLADPDPKVQQSMLQALAGVRDKAAVPTLLEYAKTKANRQELIAALSATPDVQALPILLEAVRERNGSIRRSALGALKSLRDDAWPLLERDLASGRIPADLAPEIRNAFDSGVITQWRVIGPFENAWEAAHGPERDLLASGGVPDLGKHYEDALNRRVTWREVRGNAEDGRVDLATVFDNKGMVCAYAYLTVDATEESDARLLAGSDDQLAVWVNGKKVHDSPAKREFAADKDEVPIHFVKGRNHVLLKIGNVEDNWEFAARIPGFERGRFTPSKEPPPEIRQRVFALATNPDGSWMNPGNIGSGEKLFHDANATMGAICATCHAVRGKGGTLGPDLTSVGTNYRRADLITSIHEPSKTIALGFEQVILETNAGETLVGALRQETGEAFIIAGGDGQPQVIKKSDVKSKKSLETSLMPPGLTIGLKPAEFADLLAYLESLKAQ